MSAAERARIESEHGVTVLGCRVDEDASALIGGVAWEVAADTAHGPATLYVNAATLDLSWDVSGHPAWYRAGVAS
jgi:hypothetical protein